MLQHHVSHGVRVQRLGATASSRGTSVIAAAGANTMGSWTTIGTTGFAWEHMIVSATPLEASDFLFDLGIESGGNVWLLAERLRVPNDVAARCLGLHIPLPLHVPSGAVLQARAQSSAGLLERIHLAAIGFSSGLHGAPGFSRCVALNAHTSSRGIACDPGASGSVKTRTQIVAAANANPRIAGIFAMVGCNGDIARAADQNWLMDIEAGAAANERTIVPNLGFSSGTVWDSPLPALTPIAPCDIAAGERLSVNLECSVTTASDRTLDVSLHGLVP